MNVNHISIFPIMYNGELSWNYAVVNRSWVAFGWLGTKWIQSWIGLILTNESRIELNLCSSELELSWISADLVPNESRVELAFLVAVKNWFESSCVVFYCWKESRWIQKLVNRTGLIWVSFNVLSLQLLIFRLHEFIVIFLLHSLSLILQFHDCIMLVLSVC